MPTHGATASSREAPPEALILTLGPSRDSVSITSKDDILTLGTLPLESIPRLAPFVRALVARRLRHRAVTVRYARGATIPILHVSHAKCRLESVAQLPLLQELFKVRELTSYDIELPTFGPDALRTIKAGHLETELTVRGELPSLYQFLAALEARRLNRLVIRFWRNQYDAFDPQDNADFAYSLRLSFSAYINLRAVRLRESEAFKRFSGVSLSSILRPLFGLTCLEDVEVVLVQSPLRVNDEDMLRIAHTWRGLHRLVLSCERHTGGAPTLDSLYMLHHACGDLIELVLPTLDLVNLGTDIEKYPPREPLAGRPCRPLRIFDVMCERSTGLSNERAAKIARCIDYLFPNIDVEESWRHDGSIEAILTDWYLIWVNIVSIKALRRFVPGRAYLDRVVPSEADDGGTSSDGYSD
ncbi:hypothetical protein OH77DRAFT_140055 [Trametes cingulata]|nr:hypothetical protein OH77DRAFT_140055 [Trametes cingulata]